MLQNDLEDGGGGAGHRSAEPLLEIKADHFGATTLATLLKTIKFAEKVNLLVSMAGLRFVVEEGRYVQGSVFLKAELFKTYLVRQDAFGFKIPFKELLQCLKVLNGDFKGSNTTSINSDSRGTSNATVSTVAAAAACNRSLCMTYHGHGTPFKIILDELIMSTEMEFKTEELDTLIDFDEIDKKWKITMDSNMLHEHLFELEGFHPEHVTLRVVPDNCLELRASGSAGSLMISIPKDGTGIEQFCSIKEAHQSHYKFNILRYSFRIIEAAEKIVLKMGENDVLCLHLLFKESFGAFADFYLMPLADVD